MKKLRLLLSALSLMLMRGLTYRFNVMMFGHPFRIASDNSFPGTQYNVGVTNNDAQNGILTFKVPQDAPDQLFYQCTNRGFVFTLSLSSIKIPEARFKFYTGDTVFASVALKDFPLKLNVPGGKVKVVYDGKKGKDPVILSYAAESLDSATMYCNGTKTFRKDHGVITDGSVKANYTNRCDCKWQINAPQGKRVKITFDEMDTEANKDFVWIFDGHTTLQDVLIAKFNGQKQAPVVTSHGNEVLLWFLTDDIHTGDGWKMHYDFVDSLPGYEVPQKKK